ncbi:hypothetical protein EDB19DRAFT_1803630 [Suillus lakei]|nr:hypothetical protein EDB19DRAFT_1803630 [Suillus lakei]
MLKRTVKHCSASFMVFIGCLSPTHPTQNPHKRKMHDPLKQKLCTESRMRLFCTLDLLAFTFSDPAGNLVAPQLRHRKRSVHFFGGYVLGHPRRRNSSLRGCFFWLQYTIKE